MGEAARQRDCEEVSGAAEQADEADETLGSRLIRSVMCQGEFCESFNSSKEKGVRYYENTVAERARVVLNRLLFNFAKGMEL